jgi:hypothetical protein
MSMHLTTGGMTVVSVFPEVRQAKAAIHELTQNGFRSEDIGLVANREVSSTEEESTGDTQHNIGQGAGVGAVIGGAGGLLLSLASLAIPGIGPIVAAGPLVAALGGAGVGATVGTVVGALRSTGVPEQEAQYYHEAVRRGDVLVTVRADTQSDAERARDILDRHGAVDMDERVSSWRERGWTGYDAQAQPLTGDALRQERQYYAGSMRTSTPAPPPAGAVGGGTRQTSGGTPDAGTRAQQVASEAAREVGDATDLYRPSHGAVPRFGTKIYTGQT